MRSSYTAAGLFASVLLAVVGCGAAGPAELPPVASKPLPPGCWIEDRPQPKLADEKIVALHIASTGCNAFWLRPKTVRFLRWGPHDMTGRWLNKLSPQPGWLPCPSGIRVVWQAKNASDKVQTLDQVYFVGVNQADQSVREVWQGTGLAGGDRWFGSLPDDD